MYLAPITESEPRRFLQYTQIRQTQVVKSQPKNDSQQHTLLSPMSYSNIEWSKQIENAQ